MAKRVFFYVQHLLGIGHVVRAVRVARAMKARGLTVCLAMGGRPIPGLDLSNLDIVQLPSLVSRSTGFNDLVTDAGHEADEGYKVKRRNLLLQQFKDFRPDVLLIEAFPFGRRQMRFELLALLDAAREQAQRLTIVSSIRDILQQSHRPEHVAEVIETVKSYFDWIVVHGDPAFVKLEQTFPAASQISDKLFYSGVVAHELSGSADRQRIYDVVVSAGGGAVGKRLLDAAIEAKALTSLPNERWIMSTGPNLPASEQKQLVALAARANIELTSFIPCFTETLSSARLSVSQAGYNTVADVLVAGCRAVLCPFAGDGETEQTMRAELLADKARAAVVPEAALTPQSLTKAIEAALALPNPTSLNIDIDGARRTAKYIATL